MYFVLSPQTGCVYKLRDMLPLNPQTMPPARFFGRGSLPGQRRQHSGQRPARDRSISSGGTLGWIGMASDRHRVGSRRPGHVVCQRGVRELIPGHREIRRRPVARLIASARSSECAASNFTSSSSVRASSENPARLMLALKGSAGITHVVDTPPPSTTQTAITTRMFRNCRRAAWIDNDANPNAAATDITPNRPRFVAAASPTAHPEARPRLLAGRPSKRLGQIVMSAL